MNTTTTKTKTTKTIATVLAILMIILMVPFSVNAKNIYEDKTLGKGSEVSYTLYFPESFQDNSIVSCFDARIFYEPEQVTVKKFKVGEVVGNASLVYTNRPEDKGIWFNGSAPDDSNIVSGGCEFAACSFVLNKDISYKELENSFSYKVIDLCDYDLNEYEQLLGNNGMVATLDVLNYIAAPTEAPTTVEPTTVEPTTVEPTTEEPTEAPTTEVPTTEVPTTVEPTTVEPTTVEPTTVEPTTEEPTEAPTTEEATTVEPTTVEPTTVEPTTEEPTEAPTTEEATTVEPTTEEPTEAPTTEEATTEAPTTQVADDYLKVTATSNFFPEKSASYDANTKEVTVTYMIQASMDMLNCQWELDFDKDIFSLSSKSTSKTIMPACSSGKVINIAKANTEGRILGNASSLDLYDISSESTVFVTVTLDVKDTVLPADTVINLNLDVLTVSKVDEAGVSSVAFDVSLVKNGQISDKAEAIVLKKETLLPPSTYVGPTIAPTTKAPTEAPTTEAPTAEPTIIVPTTVAPTTVATTTVAPTTEVPTTVAPTTVATTTVAPTTEVPTTVAPTTEEPTEAPIAEEPTEAPTTEEPTEAPTTEVPTDESIIISNNSDNSETGSIQTGTSGVIAGIISLIAISAAGVIIFSKKRKDNK